MKRYWWNPDWMLIERADGELCKFAEIPDPTQPNPPQPAADALADTARLEFLIEHESFLARTRMGGWRIHNSPQRYPQSFPTPREAIDAERKS